MYTHLLVARVKFEGPAQSPRRLRHQELAATVGVGAEADARLRVAEESLDGAGVDVECMLAVKPRRGLAQTFTTTFVV